MDTAGRCRRISNSYYNLGLEMARERNLSGAVRNLKRSLQFNKNHTDARNLLGLIYFEMGEVSDALVQWVISMNLQPEENRADIYLDEIQRKKGRLETYGQIIGRYNQALYSAQEGNSDLSLLQLNRVVKENPDYVRAQLLIALLLMQSGKYREAGRSLSRVLHIDRGNEKALWYMSIVRENIARPVKKSAKDEKQQTVQTVNQEYTGRAPEEDITMVGYHENTGWQTILNIGMGLLIGAAAVFFLYVPAKNAQLSAAHNADLVSVENRLNDVNNQNETLTATNTDLTTKIGDLTNQLNTIQEADTYKLSQYQKLIGILDDYRNENYSNAADLFASIDVSQLTDVDDGSGVSVSQIYTSISGKMNEEGYISLGKQGDASYEAADYKTAIAYYDKALAIKPDYEDAMFKKAMSYKQMGDIQNANNLFGEIILKFPDTEQAAQAKKERGY